MHALCIDYLYRTDIDCCYVHHYHQTYISTTDHTINYQLHHYLSMENFQSFCVISVKIYIIYHILEHGSTTINSNPVSFNSSTEYLELLIIFIYNYL